MYIDIEYIDKTLYDKVSEIVGTTFVNVHPRANIERLNQFAMVRVSRIINDRGAYKSTTAFVDIYVRIKDSGVENITKINELTNKVMALFPYSDEVFSAITPELTFGDVEVEFTRVMIRMELIIK